MSIYTEILARNAELLTYFKVAVTLAIVFGGGFSACFALWRRSEKEVEELRDCLDEAHEEADAATKGHMIALATMLEMIGKQGGPKIEPSPYNHEVEEERKQR